MSPSRLPNNNNEMSSYRPSGMLDRDQRTAFTIDRTRSDDDPSILVPECNNLKSTQANINNQYRSRASECICDSSSIILQQNRCMNKSRMVSSNGFNRSRTKLIYCLLLFICIWLATIHHTSAYPLAQSESQLKMSINRERCEDVKNALDPPIRQTRLSYGYIPTQVETYVDAEFNQKLGNVHAQWRDHPPHFVYLNATNRGINLPDDYGDDFPDSYVDHIRGSEAPSEEGIVTELQEIYAALTTINEVFQNIMAYRKANEGKVRHRLRNGSQELKSKIDHVFEEQTVYSRRDIVEIELAMKRLNIPIPTLSRVQINPKEPSRDGWLATREYLKVLTYMVKVYDILHNRCS